MILADPSLSLRARMVSEQIEARGIQNVRLLEAMRRVPRHHFVPGAWRKHAYEDRPLPIGHGQTISQPYMVAAMLAWAELPGDGRVLEIGTGSGYGAAVLADLVKEVYAMEILPELAAHAEQTLALLKFSNVHVRQGDGAEGWPEAAPFDAIIVTAAPPQIPEALIAQLKIGASMIIPLGDTPEQTLWRITRTEEGSERECLCRVRFVPMTGKVRAAVG